MLDKNFRYRKAGHIQTGLNSAHYNPVEATCVHEAGSIWRWNVRAGQAGEDTNTCDEDDLSARVDDAVARIVDGVENVSDGSSSVSQPIPLFPQPVEWESEWVRVDAARA